MKRIRQRPITQPDCPAMLDDTVACFTMAYTIADTTRKVRNCFDRLSDEMKALICQHQRLIEAMLFRTLETNSVKSVAPVHLKLMEHFNSTQEVRLS
ncbi:hypothetical protein Zmor_011949 [Zophobas morio]|uniref:Uncharacterized protein n=1 Tax=Zophobas morio TaxID=2755281 RepID=A0AA38HHU3_9CUCU|nr:hypothetical protein Zmor_011949 [Zophobas morio]